MMPCSCAALHQTSAASWENYNFGFDNFICHVLSLQETKAHWFWTSCVQKLWSQSKGSKRTGRGSIFHCWPGPSCWGVYAFYELSLCCLSIIYSRSYKPLLVVSLLSYEYYKKLLDFQFCHIYYSYCSLGLSSIEKEICCIFLWTTFGHFLFYWEIEEAIQGFCILLGK